MTSRDFAIAVNKFFYYANNYNCVDITYPSIEGCDKHRYMPDFFQAFEPYLIEHLWGKFEYRYENARTSGAAVLEFYADLDGSNRMKLLSWINENYEQSDNFGISLPKDEEI